LHVTIKTTIFIVTQNQDIQMKQLYVANWKMNMSFEQSIDFCRNNLEQLHTLTSEAEIILCPSFVALAPIMEILKNTAIAVGAQNCSQYKTESYTGEVSAQSLAEIGVKYCIIGHSERRIHFGETTETLLQKINFLRQDHIKPIICIGETKDHFINKATLTVLTEQLKPIIENIQKQKHNHLIIAYEPIWSIGTGIIPENTYLQEVLSWLTKLLQQELPDCTFQLLYGGSVNPTNIHQLKTIPNINGFLVGKASADFEGFSKIIKIVPQFN
jgi:triosephosphate isomerase